MEVEPFASTWLPVNVQLLTVNGELKALRIAPPTAKTIPCPLTAKLPVNVLFATVRTPPNKLLIAPPCPPAGPPGTRGALPPVAWLLVKVLADTLAVPSLVMPP